MDIHCLYYQAHIDKVNHLFVIGALKYYDHVCFDRTFDVQEGIVEFFVPKDQEVAFLHIMDRMHKKGIINTLEKKTNRLFHPNSLS